MFNLLHEALVSVARWYTLLGELLGTRKPRKNSPEELDKKVNRLAELVKKSKQFIAFTVS